MKFKSWHILIVVLTIVILWAVSAVFIMIFIPDWAHRGIFGDMFGVANALFSGLALAGIIYAIVLQRQELQLQRRELELTRQELHRTAESQERSHILGQTRFLIDLSSKFLENEGKYNKAWQLSRKYRKIPSKMTESEWNNAVDDLRKCYESTLFLFQIAGLASNEIIRYETLYILYYENITSHVDSKITILREWCGTGLELAANYEAHELFRIITPIRKLIIELAHCHKKQGGEPYEFQIKNIENIEQELGDNLDRFDVTSERFEDNMIEVTDK